MNDPHPPIKSPPPATASAQSSSSGPRRISSTVLMGTARELLIEHDGQEYRLRLTSNNKLILTK